MEPIRLQNETLNSGVHDLISEKQKATFKIELLFTQGRSLFKPTLGVITLWESGGQLHGGGDGAMGICPGKREGKNECEAIIPSSCITSYEVVCPKCQTAWKSEQVPNMRIARLTMRDWAEVLYKYYMKLERNADIYLKYAPENIQSATAAEQEKALYGSVLGAVRQKRVLKIYPIANIIKDTAAGADILNRFYAFLTA